MVPEYFRADTKRRILNTKGEAVVLFLVQRGDTYETISTKMGISKSKISRLIKKYDREPLKKPPVDKAKLYELVQQGLNGTQIASELGYSVGTIYSALHHMGVSIRKDDDILSQFKL